MRKPRHDTLVLPQSRPRAHQAGNSLVCHRGHPERGPADRRREDGDDGIGARGYLSRPSARGDRERTPHTSAALRQLQLNSSLRVPAFPPRRPIPPVLYRCQCQTSLLSPWATSSLRTDWARSPPSLCPRLRRRIRRCRPR
ncbi:hypothetical protein CALCODRAFT_298118 [Calocera cornea HHB12733]|uniref:Uncharacterized protein n=1 Tax=Calocera cornea HHB12733 TaxID=1353952 RepID=A0A165FMW3_9BASI|nr:hypothetical protein CALCODRAFT_298118 [Calocera cornea HHB12733]